MDEVLNEESPKVRAEIISQFIRVAKVSKHAVNKILAWFIQHQKHTPHSVAFSLKKLLIFCSLRLTVHVYLCIIFWREWAFAYARV
jgi:hypothetical protein